tara:strand:- start:134 stop:250 length:117 start_codon:yes stop_codon:yes gene_type:complete
MEKASSFTGFFYAPILGNAHQVSSPSTSQLNRQLSNAL